MAARKIVIVLGSPRKEGNSAALAGQVAEGAKPSGAEVETFRLHEMNISPCTACDECRDDADADCVIDDCQPDPSAENGVALMRIIDAVYRSAREGREVRLSE